MLKLESVHTSYGRIEAIKGINLEISRGEIVSLIGSNGAGKSTTLMTISRILSPSKGKIFFEGNEIHNLPPHEIVSRGISQVPEGRRIFPKLTVRENLEMGAFLEDRRQKSEVRSRGDSRIAPTGTGIKNQLEYIFSLFPVLKERQKQFGGTLSGGEQQMLAIGRALMSRPKLLLLDEPSLGLAPIIVSKIFKTIKELNAEGLTILLVEQNAKAALRLAHRGYVIESGRVVKEGKGKELLDDPDIKKAYLGE
ncbi:MAG: ABC transporter ATP-binding protein [Nitrospirae bacterium]|nr:ABC transporter ATP-binding protein [Nitrospirota bacterium]